MLVNIWGQLIPGVGNKDRHLRMGCVTFAQLITKIINFMRNISLVSCLV